MLVVEVDEVRAICVVVGPSGDLGNPVCTLGKLRALSERTSSSLVATLVPTVLGAGDEDVLC